MDYIGAVLQFKWLDSDQMKSRKTQGVYDETIIKKKRGRLMVNVRAHDAWMDKDE